MISEWRFSRRQALRMATAFGLADAMPALAQPGGRTLRVRVVNTAGTSNFVFQELLRSLGILDSLRLEVDNQNVADGSKVTEALLKGEADICMQAGFGPVLIAIEKGAPLKVVASGNRLNPQAIYSAKPEVRELKDLIGRTLGVGAFGAAIHQKTVALLRKRGIDEKSVRFVNVGGTSDGFKAAREGTVDAAVADIDVYADQARYGVHSLSDAKFWTDLPEYTNQASYTTDMALAEKREAIVRVVAAYAKFYRFLQSPQSLQPWLKTWADIAKMPVPTEPDPMWRLYQEAKPFPPEIALTAERINFVQDLNVSMGLQQKALPYERIADTSIAADALKLLA